MNGVALKVRDIERSMEWYNRHFGFEHKCDAEGCRVLAVGNIELALSPHNNQDVPLAEPWEVCCMHTLALEIPEGKFHKLRREFEEKDADIVNIDREDFQSIITSDPDGYSVELYYNKQPNQPVQTIPKGVSK